MSYHTIPRYDDIIISALSCHKIRYLDDDIIILAGSPPRLKTRQLPLQHYRTRPHQFILWTSCSKDKASFQFMIQTVYSMGLRYINKHLAGCNWYSNPVSQTQVEGFRPSLLKLVPTRSSASCMCHGALKLHKKICLYLAFCKWHKIFKGHHGQIIQSRLSR